MLTPVNLYHQVSFTAIKICNKAVNAALPIKLNRIITQKIIPKAAFLPRHVFPQHTAAWF